MSSLSAQLFLLGGHPSRSHSEFTLYLHMKEKVKPQLHLTLWDFMDYAVRGILQARILEWVAIPFSRGSFQPRDQIQVSHIAGGFFTSWATRQGSPRISEWVAYPFSSRSSQPRNWTGVSCIASRFFTSWVTREAHISYIHMCNWVLVEIK